MTSHPPTPPDPSIPRFALQAVTEALHLALLHEAQARATKHQRHLTAADLDAAEQTAACHHRTAQAMLWLIPVAVAGLQQAYREWAEWQAKHVNPGPAGT